MERTSGLLLSDREGGSSGVGGVLLPAFILNPEPGRRRAGALDVAAEGIASSKSSYLGILSLSFFDETSEDAVLGFMDDSVFVCLTLASCEVADRLASVVEVEVGPIREAPLLGERMSSHLGSEGGIPSFL